ncbi:MAG: ubiquinone/menaquinone biosynthesis methyltransferase [Dehalococcoidales bacterium]|nr:ubiquinone/menaquinone biosynthesis methyltransferase [Dehalococcoidales bacterium]
MAVPPRYDLINRLITWGQDNTWRLLAARECLGSSPERLLDICCGTGKLAIDMAGIADSSIRIVGVDFSLPMLELAVTEAGRSNSGERVSFVHGDAAALPFPDGHFDCVGIAFAFRNLTYKNPLTLRYLAEIVRVLRPGGRFVIVESSQPRVRLIRKLFHLYLRTFVFRLGYLLSGNRGAYRYLAESAARFYPPDELGKLLSSSGFSRFLSRPLMFGTVAIHIAVK